jgi:YbbR domain-containing protein
MSVIKRLIRASGLKLLAVIIAVVLWIQVHGQGLGSLNMEVALQVHGLPQDMLIINDLPDHVRLTVSGLQARLNSLASEEIHVPLDASDLHEPGVVERALNVAEIRLPAGLSIEKIQPDRLELQVDRVISRKIPVQAKLEVPEGWQAMNIVVEPGEAELKGPEVWLDALSHVETTAVRPEPKAGLFEVVVGVESPAGKAIQLVKAKARFKVRGLLVVDPAARNPRGV